MFGPRREEATRGFTELHNEEHHSLYDSPNIIRVIKLKRMRGEVHVARMGEVVGAHKILVRKPEGKR
jgi:hypothetical protein